MKKTAIFRPATGVGAVIAMALLMTCLNAGALPLVLNFGPNTGSSIQFNGNQDSFNFNSGTDGYQWYITSETGGTGSAVNLNGSVLNGPFSYGPITSSGVGLSQIQSATVLGPLGTLVINNAPLDNLTGTVNWIDISTFYVVGGFLNAAVNVNLSNISYTGPNPDLQTLVADQPGTLDVSFQFTPGENLTSLSTGTGPYTTSYSGSVSVTPVPEPATLALAGLGGLSVLLFRRQRK
jgi:hypothetical protein